MSAVSATWKNGQVVLDDKVAWPEGRRLVVAEAPADEIQFMTEEQQRDDPESVRHWIDEMRAIPPLPMTPEQEADLVAWRQQVKEFNLAAVRKQMDEGIR